MNLSGHDDGLFIRNMPVSPKVVDGFLSPDGCCDADGLPCTVQCRMCVVLCEVWDIFAIAVA